MNNSAIRGGLVLHVFVSGGCLKSKKIIFFISLVLLTVSFQACNKVQVTDVANTATIGANVPFNTPFVQDSCNTLPHQMLTSSMSFPKPSRTCDWEKNGNLAKKNDFFQARIEEEQLLDLPENAIICDLKFDFVNQQFLYDDHFLVTFNGAIIASSYNFGSRLPSEYGLLRYDWSKIAGMNWDKDMEGNFCAPDGTCLWPKTDTAGIISLNYEPNVFQQLMAEDITRNQHVINFISIGDNDDKDCEHSNIEFSIDVDYVIQAN